jgi:hypothetical protein
VGRGHSSPRGLQQATGKCAPAMHWPHQQLSLWRKIYAALRCVGRPFFVTGRQNTLTEHTLTVPDSQERIPLDFLLPEMCAIRQYMHNRKLAETSNRTTELSMKELRSSGSRQRRRVGRILERRILAGLGDSFTLGLAAQVTEPPCTASQALRLVC